MKVVILTHSSDRHYYFCNRLIENVNVVGVISGAKTVYSGFGEKLRKAVSKNGFKYKAGSISLNIFFRKYGNLFRQEKEAAEEMFFSGEKDAFQKNYSGLLLAHVGSPRRSINDKYYIDLIRQKNPDVIAVMGTCLLGKEIISSAPHALNLHTGLAPYYRGDSTNLWPIIEEDFGVFGATVHRMSLGIDSGDIIFTKQPAVYRDDTFGKINSRCIEIGTERMIRAIKGLESGKATFVKQWTRGKLFNSRDVNSYTAYRYFKTKEKYLSRYCELKASDRLPRIRTIGDVF
ncbi:MAG: hypothetical protein ISS26_01650 [Candidatus Omnitrophica bacterium]|nr:hypothetical protein [Candidatus Omnitrophota bacterium]